MFTVIFTTVALVVFLISLITVGFKSAFKRFLMFLGIGVVLDITTFMVIAFGASIISS